MRRPTTVFIATTAGFFTLLLWIAEPPAFSNFFAILILFTGLVLYAEKRVRESHRQKVMAAIEALIEDPSDATAKNLADLTSSLWHPAIEATYGKLASQRRQLIESQLERESYQEYIQNWAHNIKTPLSLAMLILNNHKETLSPYVHQRLGGAHHRIQQEVERILYYAKLQAAHVDLRFESMDLGACVDEVIEDFEPLLEESNVEFQKMGTFPIVFSDCKTLHFILAQLIGNGLKYADKNEGKLAILCSQYDSDGSVRLQVTNNGQSVSKEDSPFLMDKGFTGAYTKHQNPTGMGLYFAKKYADALSLRLEVDEVEEGFSISLIFPEISKIPESIGDGDQCDIYLK